MAEGEMLKRFVVVSALILSACSGPVVVEPDGGARLDAGASPDAEGPQDSGPTPTDAARPPATIGSAERPARLVLPSAYDGSTPLPAVVLLHGFGATGVAQDLYFRFSRTARLQGFYTVIPDGTVNASGSRFWNATPACCDGGTGVDDVAYLTSLLDELEALVPVSQIYFVGHSNGGFMSYRMACEIADRVSAIVSLAGSDFLGASDCVPDRAVSVLQIHGDLDATVPYLGTFAYPSAPDVVSRWAGRAGCDASPSAGDPLDLESGLAGAETETLRYATGCAGAQAELWTIRGGGHIPTLSDQFSPSVLAWLSAHAR